MQSGTLHIVNVALPVRIAVFITVTLWGLFAGASSMAATEWDRPVASSTDGTNGSLHTSATVEVRADATQALSAEPGEFVSTIFNVKNTSDSSRVYAPAVSLPEGWLLISSASPFRVEPGTVTRRVVSFRIPAGSAPARYEVEFGVVENSNPVDAARDVIYVTIGASRQLDIRLMDSDEFVLAGDKYKASFLLFNAGNSVFRGRVKVTSIPDFPYEVSETELEIPANASRPLDVVVSTQVSGIRRLQHWVKVDVTDITGEVVSSSNTSIDVLPTGSVRERPGTIPAKLRLIGFESYRGRGGQIEFEARGAIREESHNVVDVFVRTPDLSASSLFARRDEYRIGVATDQFSVVVGDARFGHSPLTEYGRNRRGVGVEGYAGSVTVGAFASKNRNAFPREDILGLTAGYAFSPRVRVSANFVDKSGQLDGQALSLRTQFEPIRNSTVDLEVGDGFATTRRSAGVSAQATGRYDLFSYDFRHLSTGRGFPGLYQDYSNTASAVQVNATEDLSLAASFQVDERTFVSPTIQPVKTTSINLQVGPSYDFRLAGGALSTSVKYVYRSQNTLADGITTSTSEKQGRLRANWSMGMVSATVLTDVGYVASSFLSDPIRGIRYGAQVRTNGKRLTSSIYFERSVGASLNRVTDARTLNIGASTDLRVSDNTELGLNAYTMHDVSAYGLRYSLLATHARHTFGFGHTVTLQTNVSTFGNVGGLPLGDVSLSYEVPLGLPSLRSSGKRLTGRVVDFETGEPLEGVVLRMGRDRVVSDSDGKFGFRWNNDPSQYLFLDQLSIGLDRLPMIPMPMTITEQALHTPVEVPVARAGELFGVVRRFDYPDGAKQSGELVAIGVEPYAVLEVTDDAGSYRTTTDEEGRFRFRGLRPGKWSIRVLFADLPESHRIENSERKHDVAPGQRIETELRTLPRKRTIRFVAGGRIAAGDTAFVRTVGVGGHEPVNDVPRDGVDPKQVIDSSSDDSLQADGRGSQPDQFVANSIRPAFEEARRAAPGLDSTSTGPMPVGSRITPNATCEELDAPRLHNVTRGETLVYIARKFYCDPVMWPKIWFANYPEIRDPNLIFPDQELTIPTQKEMPAGLINRADGEIGTRSVDSAGRYYTVKAGESLQDVAHRTLGDSRLWPRIWMANILRIGSVETITPGMVLAIPGKNWLPIEERFLFGKSASSLR